MELVCITQTIRALEEAGIPTRRGFPASVMPHTSELVAAVMVESVTEEAIVLEITVFSPAEQGGTVCEDSAVSAVAALSALGVRCSIKKCAFNGKSGMFSVPILAQWRRKPSSGVKVNGVGCPYMTALSVQKEVNLVTIKDESTGEPTLTSAGKYWKVTIEEVLPASEPLPTVTEEAFNIQILRVTGTDYYRDCYWDKMEVQETLTGVRLIRVAKTRKERTFVPYL